MRPFSEKEIDERLPATVKGMQAMAGKEMTEEMLSNYALLACDVCVKRKSGLSNAQRQALFDSVWHLLGKKNSFSRLKANMHRVIANWNFIQDGLAIPMWDGEQTTSDVLFLSVARGKTRKDQPCLLVKTKLKTGLSAGIIVLFSLSASSILYFMDKVSGCSRSNCAAEEIAGMRARLTFTVEGDTPRIQEWNATDWQKYKNRELTNARCEPGKCKKMLPCEVCKCTVSECPLAVWADAPAKPKH